MGIRHHPTTRERSIIPPSRNSIISISREVCASGELERSSHLGENHPTHYPTLDLPPPYTPASIQNRASLRLTPSPRRRWTRVTPRGAGSEANRRPPIQRRRVTGWPGFGESISTYAYSSALKIFFLARIIKTDSLINELKILLIYLKFPFTAQRHLEEPRILV